MNSQLCCLCVSVQRALIWAEVLLPDEFGAVLVAMVTADRARVDSQGPPVNTGSCGVHTYTVQQLGHHLETHIWEHNVFELNHAPCVWQFFIITKTSSLVFIHLISNKVLVGFFKCLTCSEILHFKATGTRKTMLPGDQIWSFSSQWLPETQRSAGHHTGTVGHPDLRGCAVRRPTRESLPDCNAPPEHNKTRWDGHQHRQHSSLYFQLSFDSNLVRFWCNFPFKTLEHFVVFRLMHGHLL